MVYVSTMYAYITVRPYAMYTCAVTGSADDGRARARGYDTYTVCVGVYVCVCWCICVSAYVYACVFMGLYLARNPLL